MKLLFLIPARGGSKGLPGKNLMPVAGIPLVGRSARAATLAARLLNLPCRVVCSTDDPAIADAAREWGAEVPFMRPAELATDTAASGDVVLHAIHALDPDSFGLVVVLQPTSPLTEPEDIAGAVRAALQNNSPVVGVCRAEHPAAWQFTLDGQGRLVRLAGPEPPHRRQDASATYRLNGAVYAATPERVKALGGFLGPDTHGFEMPSDRSVDVDTLSDLVAVRALAAARPIPVVEIAGRKIGPGHPCFIIAEAGVNHNGSLDLALKLVDAAAEAGADAVKFQTFRAERLVTRSAPKAEYQLRTTDRAESQFEMLKRLELDESMHRAIAAHCAKVGILFLSTPFDEESCDFLESLGLAAFKIPSGELTNLHFLNHAARKGKPMVVSTGMATLAETARAVDAITKEGLNDLILLHCVSNYPAQPTDINLRAMTTLGQAFNRPAGFSDHSEGNAIAIGAVALGACLVEKHFTIDRALPGPDHRASIEPPELKELVQRIREMELALGDGCKKPAKSEAPVARVARKSLVAARSIPLGVRLERDMVAVRRPGTGLPPEELESLLGRATLVEITEGTPFTREMLT
jgi:N,N'-diacetyllegionaminate synthase